jgi:hypothetical protein
MPSKKVLIIVALIIISDLLLFWVFFSDFTVKKDDYSQLVEDNYPYEIDLDFKGVDTSSPKMTVTSIINAYINQDVGLFCQCLDKNTFDFYQDTEKRKELQEKIKVYQDWGIQSATVHGIEKFDKFIIVKASIYFPDKKKYGGLPLVLVEKDGKWLQTNDYIQDEQYLKVMAAWVCEIGKKNPPTGQQEQG